MNVNELIEELERLRDDGWGNSKVSVFDEVDNTYLPVKRIHGYCGNVLIMKEHC